MRTHSTEAVDRTVRPWLGPLLAVLAASGAWDGAVLAVAQAAEPSAGPPPADGTQGAPPPQPASGPAAAAATSASSDAAPILPRRLGVSVKVTADVWIPRLEGDTSFGGPTYDLGGTFDLDGSEASFDGVGEIRFGLWTLALSGFDFSARGTDTVANAGGGSAVQWGGIVAQPGSGLSSRFDITSAAIEAGWDLWRPLSDRRWAWGEEAFNADNVAPDGGYAVDLRLGLIGGGRWANIEQQLSVESLGSQARYDGDWFCLYGGVRLGLDLRIPDEVPILRKFSLVAAAAAGGVVSGASGSYWQVRAGVELYLLRNIALSAGYQLVEFDADDDDFVLDGGLQGLWFGGTISF